MEPKPHVLSSNAKAKRLNEAMQIYEHLSWFEVLRIEIYITWRKLAKMAHRMPPGKRAALYTVVVLAGGWLILIAAQSQNSGLALAIGILIGMLIVLFIRLGL